MPPARALVDAGAPIALATDFNPGSAFCESLPLVCSLACTQLHLSPGGGARAPAPSTPPTCSAAPSDAGGSHPVTRRIWSCSTRPTGGYLAYHLGGDVVATVIEGGEVAWSAADRLRLRRCLHASSAAGGRRNGGTSTSSSIVDEEGQEVEVEPAGAQSRADKRARTASDGEQATPAKVAAGRPLREVQPPSWNRVGQARRCFFGPLSSSSFSLVNSGPAI